MLGGRGQCEGLVEGMAGEIHRSWTSVVDIAEDGGVK
jgi:hypothetical protein